jgi:hypothetical protein
MNSLLDTYKKSSKGDSFRPPQSPFQYDDGIAALNATANSQVQSVNTGTINRVSKNQAVLAQNTNGNTTMPGITR